MFLSNSWYRIEGNSLLVQKKFVDGIRQEKLDGYELFPIKFQLSYWTRECKFTPAAKYGYYQRPGNCFESYDIYILLKYHCKFVVSYICFSNCIHRGSRFKKSSCGSKQFGLARHQFALEDLLFMRVSTGVRVFGRLGRVSNGVARRT